MRAFMNIPQRTILITQDWHWPRYTLRLRSRIDDLYILHIQYQLSQLLAVYGMLELASYLHPLGQVYQLFIFQIVAHSLDNIAQSLGPVCLPMMMCRTEPTSSGEHS